MEGGSGAGSVSFSAGARGTDANAQTPVSAPSVTSNAGQVRVHCDPTQFSGITFDQVAQDFATTVYPLMTRATGGCTACHQAGSGRPFLVTASGVETFQLARTAGFMGDGPGSLLERLSSSDPALRMPRDMAPWTPSEIQLQATIACKVKAAAATTPPTQAQPPVFTCTAGAQPPELGLPRLSRTQLANTLQAAVRLALPADAAAIWSQVGPTFARFPADVRSAAPGDLKGGYSRFDQGIQQLQVDALYATSIELGQALTSTTTRMTALLGSCATDTSTTNDRTCLEAFIGRWGSRVLRYPLTQADITYYADMAGTTPVARAAVADVIAVLLNAPQLVYRVEHGTDPSKATSPLSAFELAARLSLHYWQEPPDETLWTAAQNGGLLDPATYQAQLDRLVQGAQLRSSLDEFVSQWLRLDELSQLNVLNANPVFKAFAGTQLPTAASRDAMIEDVLASLRETTRAGGTLSDFLADPHAYATDAYLVGLYQVPVWSGSGAAPLMASNKRSGLLTRAALLATGTANTRPIHKGYVIRNALLCQQVGAPPPNVDTTPPASTETLTTRQAVSQLTSGGTCGGCHLSRINPPGFISEGFDALGRERTHERLFDASGNLVASIPVDTAAAPEVVAGDTRVVSDMRELTRHIDDSRLFHSCFARHYFRFSHQRVESLTGDGCVLSALETAARSGAPLRDVLKSVGNAATFKARRFD